MTGRLLESLGTEDYLVEIGGEIRCRGVKPDGTPWLVGIEDPLLSSSSRIQNAVMEMRDMSVATSGNYRKYRTDSTGRRTVHTINPRCGLGLPFRRTICYGHRTGLRRRLTATQRPWYRPVTPHRSAYWKTIPNWERFWSIPTPKAIRIHT